MAVLSSRSGKFYEIPDNELEQYELPADRVKEVLGDMEGPGGPGVEPYSARGPASVVIHVAGGGAMVEPGPEGGAPGGVEPYGYWGGGYGGYGWGHGYYPYRRKRYYYYGY